MDRWRCILSKAWFLRFRNGVTVALLGSVSEVGVGGSDAPLFVIPESSLELAEEWRGSVPWGSGDALH